MYSNTDFEKLWFLYTTEGQPKGISINSYCAQQGIPYKSFYDWLRQRQKKVVPVCVEGFPVEEASTVVSLAATVSLTSAGSRVADAPPG